MGRLLSVLLVSLLTFPVWADEARPICNPTDEDSVLLEQKTAREFFGARATQTACVQKYEAAKAKFNEARATLVKMVAAEAAGAAGSVDVRDANAIDKQENLVESLRQPYLDLMAECGPCAANPIGAPVEVRANGRTEIWYKSDGSCQLPVTDRAELARSFDKLTSDLTHLKAYPRQPARQKGYNAILGVAAYDPKNGQLDESVDAFDGNGSSLYLSVKGPIGTAFSYYFFDKFRFYETSGVRQFAMAGTAVAPEGFTPPKQVVYFTASGKKRTALNSLLFPGSSTTWYVNEDGYIRYCATADFGIKSQFVQQFGRTLMLDLLNSSVEKAQ